MEEIKNVKLNEVFLKDLRINENATVLRINTVEAASLRKLAAFGLMPGADVAVIQRYPAYVLQIGFTQVALDEDIASKIIVSKP